MAVGAQWAGHHANLPLPKGAIIETGDWVVIHIDGEGASVGYYSQQIHLVQTRLDGWTASARHQVITAVAVGRTEEDLVVAI